MDLTNMRRPYFELKTLPTETRVAVAIASRSEDLIAIISGAPALKKNGIMGAPLPADPDGELVLWYALPSNEFDVEEIVRELKGMAAHKYGLLADVQFTPDQLDYVRKAVDWPVSFVRDEPEYESIAVEFADREPAPVGAAQRSAELALGDDGPPDE